MSATPISTREGEQYRWNERDRRWEYRRRVAPRRFVWTVSEYLDGTNFYDGMALLRSEDTR